MSTRAGIRRSIAAASSLGIAAIAAVLLAIGQTSGAGVARAETETDCGDGALVLVGGTWDPDAHLLDGVTRQTQYAGYTVKRVEYPASIWPLGSFGFDNSQAQGVAAALSTVQSYQASCEGKPVVIAGYSQGAGIAGDVLTDIGTHTTPGYDISSEGVSGLLYSDPRQAGNLYGQGIELVMIGVIPGLTMAGGRSVDDFGGVPVTTVCFSGDPICDLPDPLHDPIGALDGLAGYWVKHGLYPLYMYLPTTNGASWDAWGVKPLECVGDGQVNTCMLVVPSSAWVLTQQFVDDLGLDWTVPDLVSKRWRLPDILGITLGDFQPPIRWAMGWLPQLPELGYGGVLTDVDTFGDMARGLFTWNPALWGQGVDALTVSARSIALMPVNFAKYWAYTLVGRDTAAIPGPAFRPSLVAFEEWLASLRSPALHQSGTVAALSASDQLVGAGNGLGAAQSVDGEPRRVSDGEQSSESPHAAGMTESADGQKVGDATESGGGGSRADAAGGSDGGTSDGTNSAVTQAPSSDAATGQGSSGTPSVEGPGAGATEPDSSTQAPTTETSAPESSVSGSSVSGSSESESPTSQTVSSGAPTTERVKAEPASKETPAA